MNFWILEKREMKYLLKFYFMCLYFGVLFNFYVFDIKDNIFIKKLLLNKKLSHYPTFSKVSVLMLFQM